MNLSAGLEPAFALHSPDATAIIIEPRTIPTISGLKYCTTAAV